jgi:hypothetical protein
MPNKLLIKIAHSRVSGRRSSPEMHRRQKFRRDLDSVFDGRLGLSNEQRFFGVDPSRYNRHGSKGVGTYSRDGGRRDRTPFGAFGGWGGFRLRGKRGFLINIIRSWTLYKHVP